LFLGIEPSDIELRELSAPALIDPGIGPVAIAAERFERAPAERRSGGAKRAIEEPSDVVDEPLPAPRRLVARRPIGMQLGEALGPSARYPGVVLDDRGALFLIIIFCC
jgi:hypothetical protein